MKAALYDLKLRECPTTYDYFVWLTQIRILGYDRVVYDTSRLRHKKHPGGEQEARARFENFIWPSTKFAAMQRSLGTQGDRIGDCLIPSLIKLVPDGNIPRLKSIRPPAGVTYTVTLRNMAFKPTRNSDEVVWRAFAAKIGAHVIEDHFIKPILMEDRMALYAGAKMNFGVMGGPMALLLWTPYPACVWCDPGVESLTSSMNGHGMSVGGQWPFQLSNQLLVWKSPTLDNLLEYYEDNLL